MLMMAKFIWISLVQLRPSQVIKVAGTLPDSIVLCCTPVGDHVSPEEPSVLARHAECKLLLKVNWLAPLLGCGRVCNDFLIVPAAAKKAYSISMSVWSWLTLLKVLKPESQVTAAPVAESEAQVLTWQNCSGGRSQQSSHPGVPPVPQSSAPASMWRD